VHWFAGVQHPEFVTPAAPLIHHLLAHGVASVGHHVTFARLGTKILEGAPGQLGTRKCDIRAVVQSVAPVPFPVLDIAFADDGHHDEFKSYYNPALAPASDSSPIKASNGAQERGDPSEPSQ
jgi:hypothetical protein